MRLSSTCFAKTEFRTETSALPFQLLLGILDKATLRLGDNSRVDFSQTVVFLRSNLDGAQIADLMQGAWNLCSRRTSQFRDWTRKSGNGRRGGEKEVFSRIHDPVG